MSGNEILKSYGSMTIVNTIHINTKTPQTNLYQDCYDQLERIVKEKKNPFIELRAHLENKNHQVLNWSSSPLIK